MEREEIDKLTDWFENLGKKTPEFTDVRPVDPLVGTVYSDDDPTVDRTRRRTIDDPTVDRTQPVVIEHTRRRTVDDQRQHRRGRTTTTDPMVGFQFPVAGLHGH